MSVILAHGGGGHGRRRFVFSLPLARTGYEVIASHLPCFGRSVATPIAPPPGAGGPRHSRASLSDGPSKETQPPPTAHGPRPLPRWRGPPLPLRRGRPRGPGSETWTPLDLSRPIFDRLGGGERLGVVPGGAHVPVRVRSFGGSAGYPAGLPRPAKGRSFMAGSASKRLAQVGKLHPRPGEPSFCSRAARTPRPYASWTWSNRASWRSMMKPGTPFIESAMFENRRLF